jgi:predicted dehydrogenase
MKDFSTSDGSLGEGMSHDLDRVRFLTGTDFKRLVSKLVSRPLPAAQEMEIAGGNSLLLAELTDGITAYIQLVLMAGFPEWGQVINGQTGTLNVTHESTSLQNLAENEVVILQPSDSEKMPEGTDLLQHTWNRLIADFVAAIRRGDKAHETVPNLPSLEDGLKVQQVISAAHLSDTEARWADLDELA